MKRRMKPVAVLCGIIALAAICSGIGVFIGGSIDENAASSTKIKDAPAAREESPPESEEPQAEAEEPAVPWLDVPEIREEWWVATERDPLNIREEPRQSATKVGTVAKGANIVVLGIYDHWGKLHYDGVDGWVNLNYCRRGKAPEIEAEEIVWMADSNTSYSYHRNPNCHLLQKTTHAILEVPLSYARSHGHDDPCDNCAGGR